MLQKSTFAKSGNFYLAQITEFFAPLVSRYYSKKIPSVCKEPTEWKKILILGEHHIGDVLCRTCSLELLIRGLPNAEFYYATSDVSAQLLTHHPQLKGVLPVYAFDKRSILKKGALEELRQLKFDAVICTASVHYWSDLFIAIKAEIPNRVGFIHKGFSGWVTHPSPLKPPCTFALGIYRQFASLVGADPTPRDLHPRIYVSASDESEAKNFLESHGLSDEKNLIAVFPYNRQPTASWPDKYYVSLCKKLCEENYTVILAGAKGDAARLESLYEQCNCTPLLWSAGDLTLRGLYVFLKHCKAVICMDSGPRHIANAARIPVFFFRNTRAFEEETGVYCDTEVDLLPPGELLGPEEQQAFMLSVTPENVLQQLKNYF